jgi:hypothetical protein
MICVIFRLRIIGTQFALAWYGGLRQPFRYRGSVMTTIQWVVTAVMCFTAAVAVNTLGLPRLGTGYAAFAVFGLIVLMRAWSHRYPR